MADFPDWTSIAQVSAPGTASPWVSPNQTPLAYLVSAPPVANILSPRTLPAQNWLFLVTVAILPTGTAAQASLQYGAAGTFTTLMFLNVEPTGIGVVLNFGGAPLPAVAGFGAGLYITLTGANQAVLGGVTYSIG